MSVNVSPCEVAGHVTPLVPAFVRARGGVHVHFDASGPGTKPIRRAESGGYRVRFPRAQGCEAVIINTGGGMAGGDRMTVEVHAGDGASAVVTTQAAEKVYRSQGSETAIEVGIELAAASRLDWLPQETILFSQSRMRRRVDVAMAADASMTFVESVVFGRAAMGEVMHVGSFRDRWRIQRGDRLVFAEDVRLDGAIDAALSRPAIGNGARALATVLHVAPDAEARLDEMRAALAGAACECGASAWNGMLVARFLSPDAQALRADLVRVLERVRGAAMPCAWQS